MKRAAGEEQGTPEASPLAPEISIRWRGETVQLTFEAEPHGRRERLVELVRLLPRLLADLAVASAAVERASAKGHDTNWFSFRLRDLQAEIARLMDEIRALVAPSTDS